VTDERRRTASLSWTRRSVLRGTGVAAAGAVGGFAVGRHTTDVEGPRLATSPAVPVSAQGARQAGVARPAEPQPHARLTVVDLETRERAVVAGLLARLGATIARVADPDRLDGVCPDGPGDLTVTVGVGPRLVRLAGRGLPGAQGLPVLRRDGDVSALRRGGDLLLAVNAGNPTLVDRVRDHLVDGLHGASVRWSQLGFRGAGERGTARNVLGFLDGVIVPRTDRQLDQDVWIEDGPARNGSVCVVRRLVLDVQRFLAQPTARQETIIGRRRSDGTPLSGGGPMSQVDLEAKTPEGEFVVPSHSHARAAHPSFTGSRLMLRRSYSFANGDDERGLVFVSFQSDLDTFVRTQQRLDDVDDLMSFSTLTATGSFLVLPGFDDDRPLGSGLFAPSATV
jgi:dye decolorizing peroxidase